MNSRNSEANASKSVENLNVFTLKLKLQITFVTIRECAIYIKIVWKLKLWRQNYSVTNLNVCLLLGSRNLPLPKSPCSVIKTYKLKHFKTRSAVHLYQFIIVITP